MLITIIAFLIALGVIITFHEYGHYWAARRCGVKVLRFSVGFGKPLLKRYDKRGTEWVLAGIPLGGYVKMLEEPEVGSTPEQAREAFSRQPVRNRFFIVSAGPIANFILAAVIYAALAMMGTQEPAAIVAQPAADSAAALAGIERGDQIIAVDNTPVQSWSEVRWEMIDRLISGGEVKLTLDRYGRPIERTLVLAGAGDNPEVDVLGEAGLSLLPGDTEITSVQPNSAAARSGLLGGDIVTSIDGQPLSDTQSLIEAVKAHPNEPLPLGIDRAGVPMQFEITPDAVAQDNGTTIGRMGVGLSANVQMVTIDYGPIASIWYGITRTAETAWFSLKMLGNMVTGVVSWKNISGPVTIADYAGQTAAMGVVAYLGFMALVSVSIGVLNLLPVPMLDGGHLMYYVIEMVRGKPAPEKWLEMGQRIGVVLIGGLMTLAIFNDLTRLLS
jgi:regulator of sigma E protease